MLCFAILLSSVVPASPRVWVVDNQSPSANDNNPGTPAAPLKTVNKAAQNARAGDTISVESGSIFLVLYLFVLSLIRSVGFVCIYIRTLLNE